MKRMMLTSSVACMVLSIFAGCERTPAADNGTVGFRTSVAHTRADADLYIDGSVHTTIPPGQSYGVYAWTEGNTGEPDFFKNRAVTNEGGSDEGVFTYSPEKYWPVDGKSVTFQCYYPHSGAGIAPSALSYPVSYAFTAQEDPSQQVDFLVSDIASGKTRADGDVPVTFRHALARVTGSVTVSDSFESEYGASVTLTSVRLTGLKGSGTLSQSLSGSATVNTWSSLSGSIDCRLGTTAEDVILAIPQETSGIKVWVEYTVALPDGQTYSTHMEAGISSGGVSAWEAGRTYHYSVTLGTNGLEVGTSVAPWSYYPKEMSYSTEVTVRSTGRISWSAGTYASRDDATHTVVLSYATAAECTFTIDTPEGSIWRAIFRTTEGAMGAFEFVDALGNGSAYASGEVGREATLRIRATDNHPSQNNAAVLTVFVESGGKNIQVSTLVDNSGSEWTVWQNKN